jgi:RsiW-degrading membrane proteinase PrsW (M82 family)
MTTPNPTPNPTPNQPPAAGWYADPWAVEPWRWWDGHAWTALTSGRVVRKPRLPAWLSVPVLVAGLITVPLVAYTAFIAPIAVVLAFVPLCFLLPTFRWLDRVEPEPRSSRFHAVAWGAFVATLVAGVVNTVVALAAGEVVAAVVSAPLVEETMKGLGVLWAVRRREIDGVMDGIVFAGWIAVGFALVENFEYFMRAHDEGSLVQVFFARGLFTPFAHPLFTVWIGRAVGRAVAAGRSPWRGALRGWPFAVLAHALWNGSLTVAALGGASLVSLVPIGFVVLFVVATVMVTDSRNKERNRFLSMVPFLAQRYGIDPAQLAVFGDWRTLLATRKALPLARRRSFDAVHGSLARLAALHSRTGGYPAADEERLVERLHRAWDAARA